MSAPVAPVFSMGHMWMMLKELASNALPVFVAASISRAMTGIVELSSTNLNVLIWAMFLYAFFGAQTCGFLVALFMDHSHINFRYFMTVCSECNGFAWKEFVVMIMLKWLFVNKDVGYAIGAWILLVACAFFIVYIFNALLTLYFKLPNHIYSCLRKYNSDAYALAIAFSFTLVIASELYPVESAGNLAGADDIVRNPDDALSEVSGGWIFLSYSFFITFFIAFLTWKVGWVVDKEEQTEEEKDRSLSFSAASPLHSPVRKPQDEAYWKTVGSVDEFPNDAVLTSNTNIDAQQKQQLLPVIRPTNSTTDGSFNTCNSCLSYIDNIVFSWDSKGRCRQSLMHLFNTFCGYVVGCAWYTYAVMTFQSYFKSIPGGDVLGLFLYSVAMTIISAWIMGRVERSSDRQLKDKLRAYGTDPSITHDVVAKFTARYKRNSDLAAVAGRLVVGWSWSDFVTSCFVSVLSDQERKITQFASSNWAGTLIKCILALIILIAGMWIDEYYVKKALLKQAEADKAAAADDTKVDSFTAGTPNRGSTTLSSDKSVKRGTAAPAAGDDGSSDTLRKALLGGGRINEVDDDTVVI